MLYWISDCCVYKNVNLWALLFPEGSMGDLGEGEDNPPDDLSSSGDEGGASDPDDLAECGESSPAFASLYSEGTSAAKGTCSL